MNIFLKTKRFWLGLLMATIASGMFLIILYGALNPSPNESQTEIINSLTISTPSAMAATRKNSSLVPDKLLIPRLQVTAKINHVGITAKGKIGTPSSFSNVAWYVGSPPPGASGLTILDGHVNNGLGLKAVFANLSDIKKGDEIYITDNKGKKLRFVVTSTSTLSQSSRLSDLNNLNSKGSSEIALVTCEGKWISSSKTYDQRLVVIARLEST